MAKLPTIDALGGRPTPQPGRGYAGGGGQGYQPVAPTGDRQFASAFEGMGEAIYRGGSVLADSALKAQETEDRYQEAAAHSAFLRKKVELDNSFDDDPDYSTYGKRYEEGLRKASAEAGAMIKNPERRAYFDLKASELSTAGMARISDKAQTKYRDLGRANIIDSVAGNTDQFLNARDDATKTALIASTAELISAGERSGFLTAEEAAKRRAETTQSLAVRAIQALPGHEDRLRALEEGRGPDGSFPKIGKWVDYLPADKREILIEHARNGIKMEETARRADVQLRYQNALADIKYNGNSAVVSPEEIRSAYRDDPLKAEALIKNLRDEKAFYGAREAVKSTSPQEDELLLKTWTPQGDTAALTAPRYEALQAGIMAKHMALRSDPGGYAIGSSPALQAAFSAAATDASKLPAALELSDQTQARLGVPSFDRRLLGKSLAESTVRQVMDLKGEKMADAMQGLATQYGRYWPQVFRELKAHKLPDDLETLATVDSPVARVRLAHVLTAEREAQGALRHAVGEKAKDIDDAVDEELRSFALSMATAPNGGPIAHRYNRAARLLAYQAAGKGTFTPEQVAKSAAAFITSRYDFGDSGPAKVRAPKGRLGDAEEYSLNLIADLKPEDIQAPPARPGETLTIQQRESAYAQAARRGFWITNENDDGWVLMDPAGQPVMKRDGTSFGFKFKDVNLLGRTSSANAADMAPSVRIQHERARDLARRQAQQGR